MDPLQRLQSQYVESLRPLLLERYVGRDIRDSEAPAAVVDVAVARRNCASMLKAASALGLGFRAHMKTHKVSEGMGGRLAGITVLPCETLGSIVSQALPRGSLQSLASLVDFLQSSSLVSGPVDRLVDC